MLPDAKKDVSRGIEAVAIRTEDSVKLEDINDFVYVKKAVPGPASDAYDFDTPLLGCTCENSSCQDVQTYMESRCSCILDYGCSYNSKGHIVGIDPLKSSMKPVFECNRFCKCPQTCSNRVVQKGITVDLEVFHTTDKGLGLRALVHLEKGQFVCEYAGEVINQRVAKFRADSQRPDDKNYILALNEHLRSGKVVSTYVDPTAVGNAGRFINHSCEPNLFMIPVRIDNNVPRLALFALRHINKGEELSFDYSGEIQNRTTRCKKISEVTETEDDIEVINLDTLIKVQKSRPGKQKVCYCGSKICRRYLPMDETIFH